MTSTIENICGWNYLGTIPKTGSKKINFPSSWSEIFAQIYDSSNKVYEINIHIINDGGYNVTRYFGSGWHWNSSNYSAGFLRTDGQGLMEHGLSFNGVEVSENNRVTKIYYK